LDSTQENIWLLLVAVELDIMLVAVAVLAVF
jgi:hypothetical protein